MYILENKGVIVKRKEKLVENQSYKTAPGKQRGELWQTCRLGRWRQLDLNGELGSAVAGAPSCCFPGGETGSSTGVRWTARAKISKTAIGRPGKLTCQGPVKQRCAWIHKTLRVCSEMGWSCCHSQPAHVRSSTRVTPDITPLQALATVSSHTIVNGIKLF